MPESSTFANTSVPAIDASPDSVWYVRPPSGRQFGPATGEVMKIWLDEGRVASDAFVWREGWDDWKRASGVFRNISHAESQRTAIPPAEITKTGELAIASQENLAQRVTNPTRVRPVSRTLPTVVLLGIASAILLIALFWVMRSNQH